MGPLTPLEIRPHDASDWTAQVVAYHVYEVLLEPLDVLRFGNVENDTEKASMCLGPERRPARFYYLICFGSFQSQVELHRFCSTLSQFQLLFDNQQIVCEDEFVQGRPNQYTLLAHQYCSASMDLRNREDAITNPRCILSSATLFSKSCLRSSAGIDRFRPPGEI